LEDLDMILTRRDAMTAVAVTAAVAALPAVATAVPGEADVVFEFNVENTLHVLDIPWIGGRSGAVVTRDEVSAGRLIRLPLSKGRCWIRVVDDGRP
jgi:hypothetical protein